MTGGCLCGAVRFELTGPLGRAGYCHCTRCQRRTGTAASAQARVEPGGITVTCGQDLIRAWKPDGAGLPKEFCSKCGAQLWSRDPASKQVFGVRLGAIDGDPGVRPEFRQFVDFAAPWEPIPEDGLERFGGSAWASGAMGTM